MTDAGHAGRRAASLSVRLVSAAVVWLALMLAIETRFMGRLRLDSSAYIDSKGLLGDKLINLTVGTPS